MSSIASSRLAPSRTVTSFFCGVMIAFTGWSSWVSKRRSRLVTMPTTLPFFTTGKPEILCSRCSAMHLAHRHLGRDGHRVAQHAGLEALHLGDLGGLRLGREVLVDDADAAFLRDGDRQARLGHRVHGGGHERQVQLELAGEAGLQGNFARQDARVGGNEEDVVEGQRLLNHPHVFHARKAALYAILSSIRIERAFLAS